VTECVKHGVGNHDLWNCSDFLERSLSERRSYLSKTQFCLTCLRKHGGSERCIWSERLLSRLCCQKPGCTHNKLISCDV
jgi:hypothetical protein